MWTSLRLNKWWAFMLFIWLILIFTATQHPFFQGENTESVIHQFISNYFDANFLNFIIRKITHITVFALLAILFLKSVETPRFRYTLSWLFTSIYAISDEWHQSFVPGREASYKDVLLDSLSAAVVLSFIYFMKKRKKPVS
jgi:VanZ family protein